MRPVVRVIGKVLRLVGISSPEDSLIGPRLLQIHHPGVEAGSAGRIDRRNDAIVGALLASSPVVG